MAAKIEKYQAQDGSLHDSEAEADAHDILVAREAKIVAFVKAAKLDGAKAKAAKAFIDQFFAYTEEGVIPPAPAARKPRKKKVIDAAAA